VLESLDFSLLELALEHIRQQSGRHFDPRLVDLLLQQMTAILAIKEK
jgi:putative two-component system response regulator